MLRLKFTYNGQEHDLHMETRSTVGIYKRDKSITYVRWLGFISLRAAKLFDKGAKPVKLAVDAYDFPRQERQWESWVDIKPGEYVQGCYLPQFNGVFCVIDKGKPRVVMN